MWLPKSLLSRVLYVSAWDEVRDTVADTLFAWIRARRLPTGLASLVAGCFRNGHVWSTAYSLAKKQPVERVCMACGRREVRAWRKRRPGS